MPLMKNILIMVLVWALFGATNALAKPHMHGDHHEHQITTVSPFEGKKDAPSLHCLLKSHTHQGFCPHSKPERGQTATIATDCGGKTTPSIPNTTNFSSELAEMHFFLLIHISPENKLTPTVSSLYHRFTDSLDPPPIIA